MEIRNLMTFDDRAGLRSWLEENHGRERECWVACYRGEGGNGGGAAVCRGGFGGALLWVDRLYRQEAARRPVGTTHLAATQEQPLDGTQHPALPRTGTPRADDRRRSQRPATTNP